jgi:hypothetical protein
VQRKERLAHRPVASFGKQLDGRPAPRANHSPLLEHEVRDRLSPVLEPVDPLVCGLLDRRWPALEAIGRPHMVLGRSQRQSVGLGSAEDDVRQGEQIRGPLEKLVADRKARRSFPDRGHRRPV